MAKDARTLTVLQSVDEVLDSSVARARRALEAATAPGRRSEVGRFVEAVVDELRNRVQDRSLGPGEPQLAADPLFDPFLDALTDDLVWHAKEVGSERAAIQILQAVLQIRRRDSADGEAAHESEDLRTRLRAADAFDLVIEVAHDFRSPLTSILFLAETLRDGNSGPVTELQRSQLGLVYSAAFGLASVAQDVMDLARREQDLIRDQREPYALTEVFENVIRLVSPIVEEKGLELRVVVPELTRAFGHPHALSRVLLNLTTNALKFTDDGYVEVGVRFVQAARLEYYVQDTGRGIPLERQDELFQPFKRRLGQATGGHFFSGSGVGLSIARRLVEAMGSNLVLETSDEAGTRFSFTVMAGPTR